MPIPREIVHPLPWNTGENILAIYPYLELYSHVPTAVVQFSWFGVSNSAFASFPLPSLFSFSLQD
jgi:hypothetical protein